MADEINENANEQLMNTVQTSQAAGSDEVLKAPLHSFGANAIITLTNPNEDLFRLECALRGLDIDQIGNIQKVGEPLMNKEGAHQVISMLRSRAHKIQVLGYINKDEKDRETMEVMDVLVQKLMVNKEKFDIKSDVDRTYIIELCRGYYLSILDASEGGGNRKLYGTQRIETSSSTEARQKGMWERMNPFGK